MMDADAEQAVGGDGVQSVDPATPAAPLSMPDAQPDAAVEPHCSSASAFRAPSAAADAVTAEAPDGAGDAAAVSGAAHHCAVGQEPAEEEAAAVEPAIAPVLEAELIALGLEMVCVDDFVNVDDDVDDDRCDYSYVRRNNQSR